MNDSNLVTNPDCTPPGRLCDVCAWKRPIYISKMCVRVMQYETRKTASLLLTGKWKVFFLHPVRREVEVSYWTVLPTPLVIKGFMKYCTYPRMKVEKEIPTLHYSCLGVIWCVALRCQTLLPRNVSSLRPCSSTSGTFKCSHLQTHAPRA